ncbi:hypothetical protein Tco_0472468 [Tanacetum coccineum]
MTSNHNSAELGIHDHDNEPSSSKLVPKVVPPADKTATSQQELKLLFSTMYEEYFNVGNPSVSKSSALSDNLQQHDTQPTTNIHPTSEPINPLTNVNVEENVSYFFTSYLTTSPILPPSLLFDPRYFFVPEELLPPKKQIHSPSSSSTTLFNSSRNQICNLVSPSSSVYTPTPPQIFEIGKCSIKMYLKHHEEQIEDILNYLEELSFHRIEKIEEDVINGTNKRLNSKEIRTYMYQLQKKRMPPKRTSTSETPAITLDAIRQLIADLTTAMEAQTAAIASASNPNNLTGTPTVKMGNYKEFISCQPFCFNGTEGAVGLIRWFERTESVFSRSRF